MLSSLLRCVSAPRRDGSLWLLTLCCVAGVLAGCSGSGSSSDQANTPADPESDADTPTTPAPQHVQTVDERVQPSATGSGITRASRLVEWHYIVQPAAAAARQGVLVVFLGGSKSNPAAYEDIARQAASLGYGVLDLRYPNDQLVGDACNADNACFTQYRGESPFGQDRAYAPGAPAYDSAQQSVDTANSVVNRIVALLDYLATESANRGNPQPGYWTQFLRDDDRSPYVAASRGNAYPDWSRIVIAGHSQGGGDAAFLALHLPDISGAPRDAVMFSAPNDHVDAASASWIGDRSTTPLSAFWGLRNANEGFLGEHVAQNWQRLGGAGAQAAGEITVGAGDGAPGGAHRLVTIRPDDNVVANHDSTAVDSAHNDAVIAAWDYLFVSSAGG